MKLPTLFSLLALVTQVAVANVNPELLAGEYELSLVGATVEGTFVNNTQKPPQSTRVKVTVKENSVTFSTNLTNYNDRKLEFSAVDFYELPSSISQWLLFASNPSWTSIRYTFDDGDRQSDIAYGKESIRFTLDYRVLSSPVLRLELKDRPFNSRSLSSIEWFGGNRYTRKPWVWFTDSYSAIYEGPRR